MILLTLMAQINYKFICVNVYISFCIAYTFRALFINLNYTGVFGHSLSHFFKEKQNFYVLPDGCVGYKIKNPKILNRPSGVLVGFS